MHFNPVKHKSSKYTSAIAYLCGALIVCLVVGILLIRESSSPSSISHNQILPTLLNKEAIEHLRASGEYEPLAAALIKADYKIEPTERAGEYRATNHAQDLRATFTSNGIALSVTKDSSQYRTAWRLKSFGYGESQLTVGAGSVAVAGQRVEIARADEGVTEWYENRPEGLEHGFTLAKRPVVTASNEIEPLRLTLEIDGDLSATTSPGKQAVELASESGQVVMSYAGLRVWDAAGQQINASVEAAANKVWFEVDDAKAVYPLTIDPSFVQRTKLSASDATVNNLFGEGVAMSGNTIIVGASYTQIGENISQGAAYVFVRSGTSWVEQAKLSVEDGRREDVFGRSVAIDGDMAVIGAPFADIGPTCVRGFGCNQGAAYVFVRSGTVWTLQQKLNSIEPAVFDLFGHKVEIKNQTAVISEHLDDVDGVQDRGRINVYARSGNMLVLQQRLTPNNPSARLFGLSLDLDGNTIIAGAPGAGTGAAYVFVFNGATWTQQKELLASDGAPGDFFGFSVAISLDTAVVGAYFDEINGNIYQGSAYAFKRSGTDWTQRQKFSNGNGNTLDEFGADVGVSGDTIVISAIHERVGANDFQGAAYVYVYNGANWAEQQKLVASDGTKGNVYGISVLVSGNTIIIGALNSGNPGPTGEEGAAYVYAALPFYTPPFDFDGDARSDISVFRPSEGVWYVLRSSDGGIRAETLGLASDLITPADFDGDGRTDIAVFRPSSGTWYWLNSGNNVLQVVPFGVTGDVPTPADFDGDGRADVTVFRPSTGVWYRINSLNGAFEANQFGIAGDVPLPADFDGDRGADLTVFRPSEGTWYRINSINSAFIATQFGLSGDLPVPADFDGDGRADINVFRPSNGTWSRIDSTPGCVVISALRETSTTNSSASGCFVTTQFGASGDRPLVADFTGDGRADISVFRPSNGTWYRLNSLSSTFSAIEFGTNGDVPIPSAFVP